VEIERKWLVAAPPAGALAGARTDRIEQGYLSAGRGDDAEVRVRRRGEATVLTVKSTGGLERVEEELPIDARTFDSLWPLTEGRRVEKRRHLVPCGDATLEVDVYEGELDGLVTAEAEFDSPEAAHAFEPPAWLGQEVTDDRRYRAASLALEGAPAR
jgi:CYTH domain-containing protein